MNAVVDAYVDMPDAPELRSAFIGTAEYSPLRLALQALAATPRLRHIVLPWAGKPAEVPVADARLRLLPPTNVPDLPARLVGKALRSWSHAGNIFGTLMTTEYCAFGNAPRAAATMQRPLPDYILHIVGEHGFITREAIAALINRGDESAWGQGFYLADGPRGLLPILWDRETLLQMVNGNAMPQALFWNSARFWGHIFAHMPTHVVQCRRTFSLDTARGRAFCRAVAGRLGMASRMDNPPSLDEVVAAGEAEQDAWTGAMPRDIEVEITTRRSIDPEYLPRHSRPAAEMSFDLFATVMTQIGEHRDSVNITLGGFGDPVLHPRFLDFVALARQHCVGLNVRTFGVDWTEELFLKLVALRVDVINVRFGYWGKELYRALNGADHFDRISEFFTGIRKKQLEQNTRLPLIVAETVKGLAGDKTLMDFRDTWWKLHAWPYVASYNDWAGAVESKQAIRLYPGKRRPCFKIGEQMIVHADGRVPVCMQDFDCTHPAGDLNRSSLGEIWRGSAFEAIRAAHLDKDYARCFAACGACNEWFRLG